MGKNLKGASEKSRFATIRHADCLRNPLHLNYCSRAKLTAAQTNSRLHTNHLMQRGKLLPRFAALSRLQNFQRRPNRGAGEGNRTLVVSLENFCSTIELHPRSETMTIEPETPSPSLKINHYKSGGGGRIRTFEGRADRFTVCSL